MTNQRQTPAAYPKFISWTDVATGTIHQTEVLDAADEREQRREIASDQKRSAELRYDNRNSAWSAHRTSRQGLTRNEALAGADGMTSSIRLAADAEWSRATLGKNGNLVLPKGKVAEQPPPPPALLALPLDGRRRCPQCQTPFSLTARADAEFCHPSCARKFARRQEARQAAEAVFRTNDLIEANSAARLAASESYFTAAEVMKQSADTYGIDGLPIIGTPFGILIAEDRLHITVDKHRMIENFNRQVLEDRRSSMDPDVIELIKIAMERPFGITILEKEREQEYRASLQGILNGPQRMLTLFTFGGQVPQSYWRDHSEKFAFTPAEEAAVRAQEAWVERRHNQGTYIRPDYGRKPDHLYRPRSV